MIRLGKNETVLFIGDSITDGNRGRNMDPNHIMGHGFQSLICSRLGADNYRNTPKFVNKGISGDTALRIYARLGADVIKYRPSIINFMAGVNDGLQNAKFLPCEMVVNKYLLAVEHILIDTYAMLPDVKFIICEPFYADVHFAGDPYENIPHPECEAYFKFGNVDRDEEKIANTGKTVRMIQARLPALAEKYHAIYVPFQDVFDEAGKGCHMSYFIWDNIHPTFIGHQLMADRWFEVVERELGR